MTPQTPPLPLPDERPLQWLIEDLQVRILSESLYALACLPFAWATVIVLRGRTTLPDTFDLIATLIGLVPLVLIAAFRAPAAYLLTTHRLAHVRNGVLVWSLRYDQISRIRRLGGTLHLQGAGRLSYVVLNLRHAIWLEHVLWERSSR